MDVEELKKVAKENGFYLVKAQSYTRILPCTCGSKRRKCSMNVKRGKIYMNLVCIRCGKAGPAGSTMEEARMAWNNMIETEGNTYGNESGQTI